MVGTGGQPQLFFFKTLQLLMNIMHRVNIKAKNFVDLIITVFFLNEWKQKDILVWQKQDKPQVNLFSPQMLKGFG